MDCVGLASLRHQRTRRATSHGRAADLCPTLALFTLVGIAGEDDLDAPDLIAPTTSSSRTELSVRKTNGRPNGGPAHREEAFLGITRQNSWPNSTPLLDSDASAALRDQLVAELNDLSSAEQAATWGL